MAFFPMSKTSKNQRHEDANRPLPFFAGVRMSDWHITENTNNMLSKDDIISTIATAYRKPYHGNIIREDIIRYIHSAEFLADILHFSRTAFLVIDCKRWQYLYCSANAMEVMGWEAEELMRGGPVFGLTRLVAEDLSIQSSVHPFMIDYLNTIPEDEKFRYKFSFTSRLRHKNGRVVHLLQNNFFLKSDTDGLPLVKLITFTDVSDYKTNTDVVFYITRSHGQERNEIILQKNFSGTLDSQITDREQTVINASAGGLPDVAIAANMGISINTLKNHKKSIRRKLGCANTSQMIVLARLYGFISSHDMRNVRRKISQDL
jgi:DNA-binding CsgD family transcriptional regulator/PAS domain-containing protein